MKKQVNKQDQGFGMNTKELSKKLAQDGSLSKMYLICEIKALQHSSKILANSVTWDLQSLYQHEPLVPAIYEKGTGLSQDLPTPSASDQGGYNQGGAQGRIGPKRYGLEGMAKLDLLPTPTSHDWKSNASPSEFNRNSQPLSVAVLNLPTPNASIDCGGPINQRKKNPSGGQKPPLVSAMCSDKSQRLNPQFVEIMMGIPLNWTQTDEELELLEDLNNLEKQESNNLETA